MGIIIAGTVDIDPERRDAALAAGKPLIEGALGQDGCLDYVFCPDPDGTEEDDGWLLTLRWDDTDDRSDLCILDARDVAAGPVAQVHAPDRVSFGFHVNWFPDA